MNEWIIEPMRWLRWLEMKWKLNEMKLKWFEMKTNMTWTNQLNDNLIFQHWSETVSFRFLREIELSLQSRVHLLPTSSSQKMSDHVFLLRFWRDIVIFWQSCALSTTFANRGPHPRKQRPSFGDHGSHFTRKNTGLRARESFQAWVHAFPTCYTSQNLMLMMMRLMMMMVMMMMKLVWWWWWWFWCWWDWWWWSWWSWW